MRAAAVLVGLVVLLGGAPASAMIAPSVLRDVIRAALPRYAVCAGDVSFATPVTITVSFTVTSDGSVTDAEVVRDELGREEVATCVVETTLGLQFPPNDRGATVRVTYPFRFGDDGAPGSR